MFAFENVCRIRQSQNGLTLNYAAVLLFRGGRAGAQSLDGSSDPEGHLHVSHTAAHGGPTGPSFRNNFAAINSLLSVQLRGMVVEAPLQVLTEFPVKSFFPKTSRQFPNCIRIKRVKPSFEFLHGGMQGVGSLLSAEEYTCFSGSSFPGLRPWHRR